ncbi:DUF4251 domain-containing protein [Halosquirtibacter laminarini]|uniref:DUF4251 domain-containing protein n=1 Tax=Halosquirtibacter laminarini TaxID=3374600 RepID=A0AC61NPT7_9BACT|nr:DUF4251 domain-containing protein [Prolixibacteraceae bacterium]
MKIKIFAVIVLMFSLLVPSSAQTRKEKKDKEYKELLNQLTTGKFKLDATRVIFNKGTRNVQGEGYFLKMKGDSIEAYLPFFGRAYQVDYNGGGAIEMDSPISKLDIKNIDKKRRVKVSLKVKNSVDTYDIHLTLFHEGGTIIINSNKRSSITYDADLTFEMKDNSKK